MLRTITLLLVFAPVMCAADDAPLDMQAAKAVTAQMDANPRLTAIFRMCPADAFRQDAPFYAQWRIPPSETAAECGRAPASCYQRCVDDAAAGACFALARAFQIHSGNADRYAHELYAMACDAGSGAGCTNRASSLRNDPVKGERLLRLSRAAQAECEYRSFRVGCTQGDAWSCAMLGQAFQYGEGVKVDPAQARAHFNESCAISPKFVACGFAKGHLAEMDALPQ